MKYLISDQFILSPLPIRLYYLLLAKLGLQSTAINLLIYLKNLLPDRMCANVGGDSSLISSFYKGKSILVTGATGFIGKVSLPRPR